ncbi:DUF2982 domain-containing protein [Shewanella sp. Scap07]|uniref:DUF2982 domain-containing protein n=1 Tax=Shewanella sp. Scap07 TaxID=2589987 RepID=UPI0015C066A2|nr:DUF2982 domain-containing protein [Shewanella sp. Scap07]QLE86030.1 DUF2982 domain-containing protein [Shewanella sp. Scap07]
MAQDDIKLIHSITKHNGISCTLGGAVALIVGLSIFLFYKAIFAVGMVLFIIGAILLVIGIAKIIEPAIPVELSERGIVYRHRRGTIAVEWHNIQRIDIPRVHTAEGLTDLPYIGLKLKKISPLLHLISPRLATGLLTEQRPLLISSIELDGELLMLENYLNSEFTPLEVDDERFTGVMAMFGHRCRFLGEHLGYHVYIPWDCLDRDAKDFMQLLRQYQQQAVCE